MNINTHFISRDDSYISLAKSFLTTNTLEIASACFSMALTNPSTASGYITAGALGALSSHIAKRLYNNKLSLSIFPKFFHQSTLLPSDLIKRNILENLAKPIDNEHALVRFTRTDVAARQIKQGEFCTSDIEFYQGSSNSPGQIEHKRMGKGVYAIDLDQLNSLASYGEDRILRNNPSLIKITLPKGTKILDLTNPTVRQLLAENEIYEGDVAFVDPSIIIKFSEQPSNKTFYVIKDLTRLKINSVNKTDFEQVDPDKLQEMHLHMTAFGQSLISQYLPNHFIPKPINVTSCLDYPLLCLSRTVGRLYHSIDFRLRGFQSSLRTYKNVTVLHPDKLIANKTEIDFITGGIPVSPLELDSLYQRGKQTILKINHENDIKHILADSRFKTFVFSEECLPQGSQIRIHGKFSKDDLFAIVIPLPLLKKTASKDWPENQNALNQDIAEQAFNKYFNHSYVDQNQTIQRTFGNTNSIVTRPNHSVLNGLREALLSIDFVLLILKHAPNTEIAHWISQKMNNDPNFLNKIFFGGVLMRAARRGEDAEKDSSALALRSAALIYTETHGEFSWLFQDDKERASFARSFAYDHQNDCVAISKPNNTTIDTNIQEILEKVNINKSTELTIEEQFYATIFDIGHYNDHRRMFSWDRKKAFLKLDHMLAVGGKIDDIELRRKMYITLWTRAGYYLKITGAGDCDIFNKVGIIGWRLLFGTIKNWGQPLWYRDIRDEKTFFHLTNNPRKAHNVLMDQRSYLNDDLLDKLPSNEVGYLL